jgi:Fe2+ transport system protein FeoA
MSGFAKRGHQGEPEGPRKNQPDTAHGASRANAKSARPTRTLAATPAGLDVCVQRLDGETHHTRRLRELGMFEGQTVRVLTPGNPLICKVGDCRFGICQRLARCILVQPVTSTAKSA